MGAALADEFTVYIPDRRGAGNKLALLHLCDICAWTCTPAAPHVHDADVELLLAHLKGQENSLDTAFCSDEERALVVSSEPLLTVRQFFAKTPDRPS
jgi:hypothetical protein